MREGCTESIIVSGSDAAFMVFGKGDDPAELPQVGEVGATCISFQAEFGAYIFRFLFKMLS